MATTTNQRTAGHIRTAWREVSSNWRSFFVYNLFYQLVSVAVLVPLTTWVSQLLLARTGDLAVSNTGIASFLLSPLGLFWIVVAGTCTLALIYAANAGLLRMAWAFREGRRLKPRAALVMTLKDLPALVRLGLLHMKAHLVRLAPFAAIIGVIYWALLSDYDIYYLTTQTPPVWWVALSLIGMVACGIVWVNGRLYLRWILSLPALLYDRLPPGEALERSARIMQGQTGNVVRPVIAVTALLLAGPFVVTTLFDVAGGWVFNLLPERMAVLLPAIAIYMGGYAVAAITVGGATVALYAVVMSRLYLTVREKAGLGAPPPLAREDEAALTLALPKVSRNTWLLLGAALLLAAGHALYTVRQLDLEDRITVTAHRGSSIRAPENSFPAIELAIEEEADFCELDFQELADGTIVMMHDTDFLRIAGSDRKVWEVDFDEVRDLDVGSWFAPEYGDMRLKTLAEVVAVPRGRIMLNLELKIHGHEKSFIPSVIRILREADFAGQCIVTSLDLEALRVFREAAPEFRTGAILATTLGNPMRLDVEILAVSEGMASPDFIDAAHRAGKEVHVWTINDPARMSRFINLGVDSIMTDDPLLLKATLRERAELSREEKLLLNVRALLLN